MTENAKELLALSDCQLLEYCRDDAGKWASAFSAIKSAQGWGPNEIDEALMTIWFANAIERATACRLSARQQASVEELAKALWLAGFKRAFDREPSDPWENQGEAVRHPHMNAAGALLAKYDIFEKVEK